MSNIYETGFATNEEIERLRTLEFPLYASLKMLDPGELSGKSIVDVGSGPNTSLGERIKDAKGDYYALDISPDFLRKQLDENSVILADTKELPLADKSVDVSHERFMLMHLDPEQRQKAMAEILRVAKEEAVFLEYDWQSFVAEGEISEIREIALEALSKVSDPDYGQKLLTEVKQAVAEVSAKIEELRFSRPKADYFSEFISLCNALQGLVQKVSPEKITKFGELVQQVKSSGQATFIPPDIVGVKVDFK